MAKFLTLFLMVQLFVQCSGSCKKILVIPGLFTFKIQLQPVVDFINMHRPCSKAESFIYKDGYVFFSSVWQQIEGMRPKFLEYMRDNPQGIILVGGSLGAVIARGLIETTSNHNVHSLFSFAGPHQGVFDVPYVGHYVPILRSQTIQKFWTNMFYTSYMQDKFSLANAWKDPTQYDLYLQKNKCFPYLNNEIPHNRSAMFKTNLLKLKKMVLLGGDQDHAVYPWQSTLWDYFDTNGQYPKIVNMTDQEVYKNDVLGLKTMHEDGRLLRCHVPGANHVTVFFDEWGLKNCFFPYIDEN